MSPRYSAATSTSGGGGTGASKLPVCQKARKASNAVDSAVADARPSGDDAFCDAGSKRMMKHADAKAARTDRESPGAQDPYQLRPNQQRAAACR